MAASEVERPADTDTALQPVAVGERSGAPDVLRGFALLGVLAVNLFQISGELPPATGADRAATWLREFLFTAKSYSLFSLLFGLGFAIQMGRAATKGRGFAPFFARRSLILLAIGVLHGIFLWWGDILTMYALLGLLLLAFREARPRTLVAWIVGLLALATLFCLALAALLAFAPPAEVSDPAGGPSSALVRTFTAGSYLEVTGVRARRWAEQAIGQLIFAFPNVFAMFLLGLYLGKREAFARLDEHLPLVRHLAILGLLGGIPLGAVYVTIATAAPGQDAGFFLALAVNTVGAPLLMLGYLGALTLLARRGGAAARALGLLAPIGQTALSNYLLQSVLMNLLVFGYGLGLYGRLGAATGLAWTAAIYLAQIALSNLYVRAFRYGPAEWLWRTLTYGKAQPPRLTARSATPPS